MNGAVKVTTIIQKPFSEPFFYYKRKRQFYENLVFRSKWQPKKFLKIVLNY